MKIIIIGLLTLLSFNARSISPDEQLIYMRLLNSSELSEVKLGAKAMHNERPQDQALWDHTAYILWTINTTTDKDNDNFNDTNAWLIRALTEYNNPRYRAMLTQLQKAKQP
ncbi:hypothetical protein [Shewanella surugensis]|uniref:Uncharacterized protein n=1 Tax=Shewanella surugensis TaxID=212020 RepID=A0ABT0LIL2_9GAMM|nr:hypothetical protein [Shewanella surugensis]MCL1127543.1 hypothetical protein [Shewanella surugensis]